MYKDKAKQREANRRAQAKFKAKKVLSEQGISGKVLPEYPRVSDRDFTRLMTKAGPGNVRVSKPGDPDYVPQCETTKAFVESRPKNTRFPTHKRGKDIKEFNDLPLDVQQTIRTVSDTNEEFQRRTGIAIRYQHVFPERYTP